MTKASATESRRKRLAAGQVIVQVILSKDGHKALKTLQKRHALNITETVELALMARVKQ